MSAKDTTDKNKALINKLKGENKGLIKSAEPKPATELKAKTTGRPKKKTGGRPEIAPKERRSEQVCLYITPAEMEHLQKEAEKDFIKVNQLLYKLLKQNEILPK